MLAPGSVGSGCDRFSLGAQLLLQPARPLPLSGGIGVRSCGLLPRPLEARLQLLNV